MPEPTTHPKEIDLKRGLKAWAELHGITPTKFADATGYRYAHAQGLLSGPRPVTYEILQRFIPAYGAKAASELLALAGLPVIVVSTYAAQGGAEPVVAITPAVPVYVSTNNDSQTQSA
jgi:hypothetical protein